MPFNSTNDLFEFKTSLVTFFGMMARADTLEDNVKGFYTYALGWILVGLSNFILLNLIIAIVGDSYEEIMTSVSEKNLRQ